MGNQCRHNTSLNISPSFIANLMPTLSYCKSTNICSPNLLLLKVSRYEKLLFDPFALRLGSALHRYSFILHNAHEHHALPCFFAHALLCFALPAFALSPCPALSCHALSSPALSFPVLLTNSPISGRSKRKVLRLIHTYIHNTYTYIYIYYLVCHCTQ